MNYEDTHDRMCLAQTVYWNQWKKGDIIHIELIDYFKSPIRWKNKGKYQIYYAVAEMDYKHLGFKKGDELIVYISHAAYSDALNKLPYSMKLPLQRKLAEGKNLFIKIEGINDRIIKVHYAELREPKQEHLEVSEDRYEMIRAENPIYKPVFKKDETK